MKNFPLLTALGVGLLALAAPGAVPPSARAAEPITLAWRLAKGDVLRYRTSTEQIALQRPGDAGSGAPDGGGEPVRTKQVERIEVRLTAIDTDPATRAARVVCRYEHVAIDLEQMMLGRIRWDSHKREDLARSDEPTVRPYARLLGQEFSFLLSPTGTASDVRGHDKVRAAILAGLEDSPFAAMALGSAFGDEAVRSDLERSFAVVPSGPVEVGASWMRPFEQPLPLFGTIRHETRTVLERVAGGKAYLAFEATLAPGARAPAGGAGPLASKIEVDFKGGKGKGTAVFDARAGRLERSEAEVEMQLVSRLLPPIAPKEGPGAASVQVDLTQKVVVELLPPE